MRRNLLVDGNALIAVRSLRRFCHDLDFFVAQAVKLIDKSVDLAVSGSDLAGKRGLLLRRPGGGLLFVQRSNLFNQTDDLVVGGFLGLDRKIDDANRQFTKILLCTSDPATSKQIARLFYPSPLALAY